MIQKHERGVILVTVLVFLLLLMILGISAFDTSLLEVKISTNTHLANQYFESAESALRAGELATQQDQASTCFYSEAMSADYFKSKEISWWIQNACHASLRETELHFVVERIAMDPCVQMTKKDGINMPGVVYYRVSARAIANNEPSSYSKLLQSTLVKAEPQSSADCEKIRDIPPGRQSWRQL